MWYGIEFGLDEIRHVVAMYRMAMNRIGVRRAYAIRFDATDLSRSGQCSMLIDST